MMLSWEADGALRGVDDIRIAGRCFPPSRCSVTFSLVVSEGEGTDNLIGLLLTVIVVAVSLAQLLGCVL